ncbi:MAG: hypothetical protein ACE5K8_00940 [Candidatus Zixiibacteriota bacterium]
MMMKSLKLLSFLTLLLVTLAQVLGAYEIPPRKIEVKPYLNLLFPNDLLEFQDGRSVVKNKMGFGFGLKIRNQIKGSYGFVVNSSITDVEVTTYRAGFAVIFTGGLYISTKTKLGDLILDCGYGVLSTGGKSETIIMPTLEFNRPLSNRLIIAVEVGCPVANDWFYDFGVKERYKSFALSFGSTIVF